MRASPLLLSVALTLSAGGCAATLSEAEPAKDVVCFEKAKVSLSDAIRAAERATQGHAVAARYRQDEELGCLVNKPGVYDVTLLDAGGAQTVAVNARNAAIGSAAAKGSIWHRASRFLDRLFERDSQESAALASAASPNLLASIAAAERAGGKAMAVYVDEKDARLGYAVTLVEDGKARTAWVDSGASPVLAQR
jgi:uncharacterized membrane protein YkoI